MANVQMVKCSAKCDDAVLRECGTVASLRSWVCWAARTECYRSQSVGPGFLRMQEG